jgi:hypothetical protein
MLADVFSFFRSFATEENQETDGDLSQFSHASQEDFLVIARDLYQAAGLPRERRRATMPISPRPAANMA